ncbi:MAG: integral rane protein [Candidatus Angelobacter sp.]|nr:integral rane protein [Candidatus Angelobacter sp.]
MIQQLGKPSRKIRNPTFSKTRTSKAEGSLLSISPVRGYSPGKASTTVTPALPMAAIAFLVLAVHGPLLLMQLPAASEGGSTQIFLAQHYAQSWFNPWNEKWFAGFSQTGYPPLTQQWVGLASHLMSLTAAYMLVQLCVVILLAIGTFRFARLWVDERSAGYAAIGSIFLGSLSVLVYQAGDLPATASTALAINGVVYLYGWARKARFLSLLKGLLLLVAAATADPVTAFFGTALFALPVIVAAWMDHGDRDVDADRPSPIAVLIRAVLMLAIAGVVAVVVLAPFWPSFFTQHRLAIANGSRDNFLLNFSSAVNYWLIPMGAVVLALPYIFLSGLAERRLRPLFFAFYIALIFGLGGTTPVARIVLGRFYESFSLDRFTFWATLLALPILGELASRLIERYSIKASIGLGVAAVLTFAMPLAYMAAHPANTNPFRTDPVIGFLNRDNHDRFRYLTLGFGPQFAEVGAGANASTVDGDPSAGRTLPEVAAFGVTHFDAARNYGSDGMEALRAVLKHASQYGLKFIFVRDRYYEPLLAFAGWRQVESYENGNVTLWSKEDVPPARKIEPTTVIPYLERMLWGIVPVLCTLLAFGLILVTPERRRTAETIPFPTAETTPRMQEAR